MIVGSLLLILVAVVALGLGLARGSDALLIGSIVASLLAAVALIVAARRAAVARPDVPGDGYADETEGTARLGVLDTPVGPDAVRRRSDPAGVPRAPVIPVQEHPDAAGGHAVDAGGGDPGGEAGPGGGGADLGGAGGDLPDEDPPDEPPAQRVRPADAARVARLTAEVLVVDGRPRYHLASCVHLLGRDGEALPVGEAVELGFTPCSLCEPDSALLAGSRRA